MTATTDIIGRLHGVRPQGKGYVARCPAHEDQHASLSITAGEDGRTLLHCHAGCRPEDVANALGLEMRDLFDDESSAPLPAPRLRREVASYNYTDESGALLYQTVRYDPKDFRQRRPDASGRWLWNLTDVRRVLYRLPEVIAAAGEGRTVFVVEGEKDADELARLGLTATTNVGGAGKWRDEYVSALRGAQVVVLPDNDEPGEKHAAAVALSLHGIAASVRVVRLPGLPAKGDVSDWLAAGSTRATLERLAQEAVAWQPERSSAHNAPVTVQAGSMRPHTTRTVAEFDTITPGDAVPRFAQTDMGRAERLLHHFGRYLRYAPHRKLWLVWQNGAWRWDEDGLVLCYAKDVACRIHDEVSSEPDSKERERLSRFAFESEALYKIRAMVEMAEDDRRVVVRPDEFDADPWLLGVANGVLDLRTGTLLEPDPRRYITKYAAAPFDLTAECPRWRLFLEEIMGGDSEKIGFLQRAIGYSLTGETREECLFLLWGSGQNGKSKFVESLGYALGDYAYSPPMATWTPRKQDGSAATPDLAALHGPRFVFSLEANKNQRLNEGLVKLATGGDRMNARRLHCAPFQFLPQFKLWLALNHKPAISDIGKSMWRRIHLVPFDVQISDAQRDKTLAEKLKAEAPGILRWAVEGCLAWQRDGLRPPASVRAATEEYRGESDELEPFLAECCIRGEHEESAAGALFDAYQSWAETAAVSRDHRLSSVKFGRELDERGHLVKDKKARQRVRSGIRVRTAQDDGGESEPGILPIARTESGRRREVV